MSDRPPIIKHMIEHQIPGQSVLNTRRIARDTSDPAAIPTERLEARICELAGHLTATTCRFLLLVADFDAREG